MLTVVPLGNAPGGTETTATAPETVDESVVVLVLVTTAEVGEPKKEAEIPDVGGGADDNGGALTGVGATGVAPFEIEDAAPGPSAFLAVTVKV
jgi:hypothetical protein